MGLIKLTVTKTNQKALINISRIESVMPDAVGSSVLLVDSDTPFKVNESQEQIERLMLRDQFAVAVLPSMPSNPGLAYSVADAMLEERGK